MCCRLFLENSRLEHTEGENNILGQGGSGTVIYQARYQGQPVAVKRFHIKKFKNSANAPAGNGVIASTFFFRYMNSFVPELQATLGMTEVTCARGAGGEENVGAGIAGTALLCAWPGRLGSTSWRSKSSEASVSLPV